MVKKSLKSNPKSYSAEFWDITLKGGYKYQHSVSYVATRFIIILVVIFASEPYLEKHVKLTFFSALTTFVAYFILMFIFVQLADYIFYKMANQHKHQNHKPASKIS